MMLTKCMWFEQIHRFMHLNELSKVSPGTLASSRLRSAEKTVTLHLHSSFQNTTPYFPTQTHVPTHALHRLSLNDHVMFCVTIGHESRKTKTRKQVWRHVLWDTHKAHTWGQKHWESCSCGPLGSLQSCLRCWGGYWVSSSCEKREHVKQLHMLYHNHTSTIEEPQRKWLNHCDSADCHIGLWIW